MTKWIRYDGPGHTLTLSDTLILGLGSAAPVDDELAQLLLDSPDIYGHVTVIDSPVPETPPVEKPGKASTDQKEKK